LEGCKSRQIATIHDEIHLYFHPDDAHLVQPVVDALEQKRFEVDDYVPLKIELSMGPTWGDMEDCSVSDVVEKLKGMKDGE